MEQDLWDDGVIATPMEEKIALALELERATRAADPRVRQVSSADYSDGRVGGGAGLDHGHPVLGPPHHGLRLRRCHRRRGRRLADRDRLQRGPGARPTSTPTRPWATPSCAPPGCSGAQKAQSGRCTVVFDPRVVSTLLSVVASALSGEAVVKGRSFFAGRIGESVANAAVTLVDDPTDSRAFSASTYDGEGLACRRNVLISDGMLRMFVFDTVSARRAQTQLDRFGRARRFRRHARRPAAGPWCFSPGPRSADDILASVGDGLYVQSVTGIHSGVNPVSGDFSVGAEGLHDPGRRPGRAGA